MINLYNGDFSPWHLLRLLNFNGNDVYIQNILYHHFEQLFTHAIDVSSPLAKLSPEIR